MYRMEGNRTSENCWTSLSSNLSDIQRNLISCKLGVMLKEISISFYHFMHFCRQES